MIVSHSREKLVNAIVFFADRTSQCGKVKLFKLLYLLDLQHFIETGRSVTGVDYYAWRMGPVPIELAEEWLDWEDDLGRAISVELIDTGLERPLELVKPNQAADLSYFSNRERRILERLVTDFRLVPGKAMIEVTHQPGGPWEQVWADGRGNNQPIPLELALNDENRASIMESANEFRAFVRNFAG